MSEAPDNIYEDGQEPDCALVAQVYMIRHPERKYDFWARIEVDTETDYVEVVDWRWGSLRSKRGGYRLSEPEDKTRWDAMQEVYEWLREWGIIRLCRIGPDDSEYFVTEEFKEESKAQSWKVLS